MGVGLLVVAIVISRRMRSFLSGAASAEGTVVEARTEFYGQAGSRGVITKPVVRFTTADGREVEFADPVSVTPGARVGRTVPVRYDPQEPERARIAKTFRLRFAPWVLAAVGIGCLFMGTVVLVVGLADDGGGGKGKGKQQRQGQGVSEHQTLIGGT